MPSLSQAQPSGYALSVGEILNIASLATKLQQDNFENQKNLQQGEGMTSQGSAQAIQNVTNKQADGMAAGAVGEIESSAIGLSGTVLTQAFDAYSTYSNKLTSEIESVDAFDEQLTTLNKRPANVQLQNLDGSIDDDTREQLNAVKTVDIKTARKGLFGVGRGDKDMGHVTIRTEPSGATILVNGQPAPKPSPTEILLNAGGYELTFQLPGYKELKKVIVVDSGSKMNITETLQVSR